MLNPLTWAGFGQWAFAASAFAFLLLVGWRWDRRRRAHERSGLAEIAAFALTALWALVVAGIGTDTPLGQLFESFRSLGWLGLAFALFTRDGRDASVAPIRPMMAALLFVELLQPLLFMMTLRDGTNATALGMIFHISVLFRLLVATGALVLVHNLYAGAMAQQRAALRWTCAAMAMVWGYDLNLYTIAYLARAMPPELAALRGLALMAAAALLVIGAVRGRSALRFSPSRAVAFQSLSLLVIGAYMLVMVGAAQSLAWLGGNSSQLAELGFVFVSCVLVVAIMPSSRVRGWLKVMLAKHFFQHRYDYRAEWLRFTRTIGRAGAQTPPLHERVVQALADITDSSTGLLLVPAESGELVLASRWQWPTADVPAEALAADHVAFFEKHNFIVDLDEVRAGIDFQGERAIVPEWLCEEHGAWALVPLLHFDRLVGLVVLGRPPVARKLDWEDFDLLRVVGMQLASYLAENAGQSALLEASRFDEFNRRMAFVMHDIKNLASQLSLLSRNAEKHAENPAFRADMLITLRNSADKLNGLLARLSRYGGSGGERVDDVDAGDVIRAVAERYNAPGSLRVHLVHQGACRVLANREALEQVLLHLVQNAIDASPEGMAVFLQCHVDGINGCIEVVDTGCGMSADFMRNRLFKPFVSTKPGGFGIGAFEAREMVRAMRGKLEVESREGLGSRFAVRLPLAAAQPLIESIKGDGEPSGGGTRGKKVA
ncbi:PEP-CTERM system histidine kinase PrsK [Novosphingobium sp. ERN07]|uniref:XrtA/PEP-CTERM system histidine kinase PrsK n=1 Tax=Novosphingobium sp. ERN07 TaxID=2726187 RepID=UPI0014574743|nr:XrtA/PEP-CTERM system histidine kinase PrsK [Novosphingobium sp. ERN07]NLR71454.1 PEP-CTERM system histidine kinase PrsK [Novosphingobium sp. ERN07]